MGGSNRSNQQTQQTRHIPEAVVEQIVSIQYQKVLNEAEELKIRSKEIEVNARLAEKSLDLQGKIVSSKPGESRKTITRLAYILGGFTFLFLAFLGALLMMGKDDFAYTFIKGLGYVATTFLGYWAGKQRRDKSSSDGVTDAEVID